MGRVKRLAQSSKGDGAFLDRHLAQECRRPTSSQSPFFLINARLTFVCFLFLFRLHYAASGSQFPHQGSNLHPLQWELSLNPWTFRDVLAVWINAYPVTKLFCTFLLLWEGFTGSPGGFLFNCTPLLSRVCVFAWRAQLTVGGGDPLPMSGTFS